MTYTLKILAACAALAMMGGVSAAAFADGAQQMTVTTAGAPQLKITYADLQLDQPAGMQTLERRIIQAAKRVCDQSDGRQSLATTSRYHACVKAAKVNAMKGVAATVEARTAQRATLASR